mmetsp:Transcript_133382/g.266112  ORF Transcript_133382/g.266112 Transcript_133382/m.266112 type:complete len:91 (+) Transcript_133382:299-571(+)
MGRNWQRRRCRQQQKGQQTRSHSQLATTPALTNSKKAVRQAKSNGASSSFPANSNKPTRQVTDFEASIGRASAFRGTKFDGFHDLVYCSK